MKYKSDLIHEILENRGHEFPDLHYQSECVESWIKECEGSYPKLCDYESEWLNYIVENPIGNFPYETVTANPTAIVHHVVPYAYKSAILKGQTLVNLVPKKIIDHIASSDWDGYCCLVQNSKQSFDQWRTLQDLKPNTKYYISCYVETFEDANNKDYCLNNPSVESIFGDSMIINGVGRYQWLSTTKSELTDEIFIVLRSQNAHARGAIKIRDIMIIEYQEGIENWDIPYFEGMQSVQMPVLKTFNNIVDFSNEKLEFEYGVYFGQKSDGTDQVNNKGVPSSFVYTLNYIIILDGKDKMTFYGNDTVIDRVVWFDENKKQVGSTVNINNRTLDIPTGAKYFRLLINDSRFVEDKELAKDNIGHYNIYYGGANQVFNNEPHKSNILTVNADVTLRSNGDVYDEINLLTGRLTQRIDENTEVLAQEIVKTVDLSVVNQDGEVISKIKPIEGTMLVEVKGTPIAPTAILEVPVEAITQNLNSFIEGE